MLCVPMRSVLVSYTCARYGFHAYIFLISRSARKEKDVIMDKYKEFVTETSICCCSCS